MDEARLIRLHELHYELHGRGVGLEQSLVVLSCVRDGIIFDKSGCLTLLNTYG